MTIESVGASTSQPSLICVPPLPQCEVSVIIPVKDEAQTIAATLTALANQTCLDGQPLTQIGSFLLLDIPVPNWIFDTLWRDTQAQNCRLNQLPNLGEGWGEGNPPHHHYSQQLDDS
jgi:hypothetical protein